VIVTNPVDAMATLFKKVSGADFVIGTGDHPDTLRMRTKLSMELGVPVSKVDGFVGGEHGSLAFPLWSTVKIDGKPLEEYLTETGKELNRETVVSYVRGVSKKVVDIIGGTEVGPAAGFRDIVRSILEDRGEVYSVSQSLEMPGLPEPINVNVPTKVGKTIGPNIWNDLPRNERANIIEASQAIYANYQTGLKAVGRA
jgi:malate dehydrogenase